MAPRPYIVLVGLDLSEPGGRAWRFAFDLAAHRGDAEIHAMVLGARALAPSARDIEADGENWSAPASDRTPPLKVLQHRSAGGQARLMAMHFRTGRPERAILDLSRELHADLIVVAAHPPTRFERLLGGGLGERVVRGASCPVVVVRPRVDDQDPGIFEYEPMRRTG